MQHGKGRVTNMIIDKKTNLAELLLVKVRHLIEHFTTGSCVQFFTFALEEEVRMAIMTANICRMIIFDIL